ncbi:MAG: hypothetical protein ACFB9M_09765 [Myxococcota bacterium]
MRAIIIVALAIGFVGFGCGDDESSDTDGTDSSSDSTDGTGSTSLSSAADNYCSAACEFSSGCAGISVPSGCESACEITITSPGAVEFFNTPECIADLNAAASCFRNASCDESCDISADSSGNCGGSVGGDELAEAFCEGQCNAVACLAGSPSPALCETSCEGFTLPEASDPAGCEAALQTAIDCLEPCDSLCTTEVTAANAACM